MDVQQRSSSDMDTAMEDAAAAKAAASSSRNGSADSDSDSPRLTGLQAEALRNILGTETDKQVGLRPTSARKLGCDTDCAMWLLTAPELLPQLTMNCHTVAPRP